MAEKTDQDEGNDPLVRLAAKVADGEPVDWETEASRTPALDRELKELRWIETITQVRRAADTAVDRPGRGAEARPGRAEGPTGPLGPGDTWGALTIVGRIGWGSAGDVYRAFDPALGREVALKIWREDAVYRTTGTEARRLSKVRHPRILNVLGSERHDGLAGMWTDFLEGRNLEEALEERGPLEIAEACRIGVGVCEALEAMHESGMVHRDIKTSNVMWLADESVVLIDFGSVKELPRGTPEHTERIRGTPLATAPELLLGGAVGPAADIYSLGVLLYRLVTGAYPIEAGTLGELFEKIEGRQSVPLERRAPGCDPAFADLVDRALAWDPAGRPRSATDVRLALLRIAG